MEYGEVAGIEKPVSRLVYGAMVVGSLDRERANALLDDALEVGWNTFDSAHVYGEGVERSLGRWMKDRGVRQRVVILGKGAHPDETGPRVNPLAIRADLEDSMRRMETDHIDLYMLHRDDPSVPVGPIVETLNALVEAGKISAFGGSNWTHGRIREANAYAEENGLIPFAASSPNFSLVRQVGEPWGGCLSIGGPGNEEARRWYRTTQMPVFAWSSLGRGFLSGRVTPENYEDLKGDLDPACRRGFCSEDNVRRLGRAIELAEEKGISVPQLALAYVLNQGLNVFPLVGCRNRRELEDDVAALDVELTAQESAWLDLRADGR